jgi:predicted hydrocarbon binding protein
VNWQLKGGERVAAEVSGKAFLGIIRWAKENGDADLIQRAVAISGSGLEETFSTRIKKTAWYPYQSFTDFLVSLDCEAGGGDAVFCRRLGAEAGVRDLNTIFRIYRAVASPERLIRSCANVWESYYRGAGRMEAVEWKPEETVVRIYDFPQMHGHHCRLMEGWMIAAMELIGVEVSTDAAETKCTSRGDPYHEFRCSWKERGGR